MGSELEPPRRDGRGDVMLVPSQQTYLELEDRYGLGPNPNIDGRRILGFLRRRWATIVGGFLLVMLVASGLTYMAPRIYESSASFLVEQLGNLTHSHASCRFKAARLVDRYPAKREEIECRIDAMSLDAALEHFFFGAGDVPALIKRSS